MAALLYTWMYTGRIFKSKLMIGKKIHYKNLIEFKGTVVTFDPSIQKWKINITEWIGRGYPHLVYWLTEEQINSSLNS